MTASAALITGFEPYGGRGLNPAAEVARRLDGERVAGVAVAGRVLPVSIRALREALDRTLAEVDPVAVVSLGLWPGGSLIRLERVALNLADFQIPDNDGELAADVSLEAEGATARLTTLPLRAIEQALLEAGIPVRLSSTAGTYLCNAALYGALGWLDARKRTAPCGFIHLPYLPAQVAAMLAEHKRTHRLELHQRADLASMDLSIMVEAVRIALRVTLAER